MGRHLVHDNEGKKSLTTEELHGLVSNAAESCKSLAEACRKVGKETGYTYVQCRNAYYSVRSRMERGPNYNHGSCILSAEEEQAFAQYIHDKTIEAGGISYTQLCRFADSFFKKTRGTFKLGWAKSFVKRHTDTLELHKSYTLCTRITWGS